jgi:hypothetical protein
MTFRSAGRQQPVMVGTHLLDNRQNPGLRIIVAVGTDAKIDLVLERVRLVGSDKAEQRVGRGQGNRGECGGHCAMLVGVEVVLDRGETLGRSICRNRRNRNRRLLARSTHFAAAGLWRGFCNF